jgi:membrane fusion protein (multidrug efflux system)
MSRSGSRRRDRGLVFGAVAALGIALLFAFLATSCGNKADSKATPSAAAGAKGGPHAAAPAAKPGGPGGKGGPGGPPPEQPTNVAVDPVRRGVTQQRYVTTATLEPENHAELLARTGGVVAKLLVEEGTTVEKGQDLLLLDDSEAKLRVRQAEVALAKVKSVHDRQKASFDQQVISQAEYDIARTNMDAAQADLDLAQHMLSYTRITAPFSGTVVHRSVNVGQTVNVGTTLFEIANFHPLLARIFVPAKELGTLQSGQDAELTLDSNNNELRGSVRLVSPVADPNTGTIKVTVAVHDYPAGTRSGDFVHVSVITAKHDNSVRVPNLAVFEDRGERIVYVAHDSVAVRKAVQVGFMDDTHTEILQGLDAGEQVIVKGQRSLKDGAPIKILEATETKDQGAVADRRST